MICYEDIMAKNPPQPKPATPDPLAALKLSDPNASPVGPETETAEQSPDGNVEAPPPPDTEPPAQDPEIPEPVAPVKVPKYEVQAMKRLSFKGQMITLKLGKIVSEESHGKGAIEIFKNAGVPLKLVEDDPKSEK